MRLVKAFQFAAQKHKGQERRGSGLPYVIHPIIVSHLISKYKGDSTHIEDLQIAALLHDTLEDTDATYHEIEREFGPLVASIVMELTSDTEMIKKMGKNEYLIQKMILMSKYAFVLKLVDRFSNIVDEPGEAYVKKTLLMMSRLKDEREDLTDTQYEIILDIERECLSFQSKQRALLVTECELDLL